LFDAGASGAPTDRRDSAWHRGRDLPDGAPPGKPRPTFSR